MLSLFFSSLALNMGSDKDLSDSEMVLEDSFAIQWLRHELAEAYRRLVSLGSQVRSPEDFHRIVGFNVSETTVNVNPGGPIQRACQQLGSVKAKLRCEHLIEDYQFELPDELSERLERSYERMKKDCKLSLQKYQRCVPRYEKSKADYSRSSLIFFSSHFDSC